MRPLSAAARPVLLIALLAWVTSLAPVAAMTPASIHHEGGLQVALDSMRQLATDTRSNKTQKRTTRPRPGLPVKLGKDGRLTVLLIGSDWRPELRG